MGSTIKLYYTRASSGEIPNKKWRLNPTNLFVITNISSYLATWSSGITDKDILSIANFQYIKNALELEINVDLSQEFSQPSALIDFKYISIQNTGERINYYFVKNQIWRSKSCVRFVLVMDVLNTFHEGVDFIFKANTRIIREHKDRYVVGGFEMAITPTAITSYGSGVQVGDVVNLKSDSNVVIASGYVSSIEGTTLYLQVTSAFTISQVKADLQTYSILPFKLGKDNSNYVQFTTNLETGIVYTPYYWRKIDLVTENINPMLYHNPADDKTTEDEEIAVRTDWFLIYRNQNDYGNNDSSVMLKNPVECYLMPKKAVRVTMGDITSGRITSNNLNTGFYYYIPIRTNYGYDITLSDGTNITGTEDSTHRYLVIAMKNEDGTLTITRYTFQYGTQWVITGTTTYNNIKYITLNNLPYPYYDTNSYMQPILYCENEWGDEDKSWDNTDASNYLDSIDSLDRTDSKIIKIIKLPYVPYDFNYINHRIDVPNSDWQYTSLDGLQVLKLNNLSTKLEHTFEETNYGFKLYKGTLSASNTDLKSIENETKLYHSEFYSPTWVYDSFTFKMQLEKMDLDYYKDDEDAESGVWNIKFNVTSTINSRFMFTFANYKMKYANENYYNMFTIIRNNDEVLYNVAYINFIRSGYNYEVKAKQLQNASNWTNFGLSATATLTSFVLPSAPLKVAGVVAGLVSMASSVKSAIVSQQQSENEMQSKLTQLKNQTSSVAGSDDVDLMSVYAENRIKFMLYKPSEIMENLIYNLFFYAGYNSGRIGMPNHNTRINFDYLECEASIEALAGGIPQECLEELIACFKNGVTYIHQVSERTSEPWDLEQKYENWEKMFFE